MSQDSPDRKRFSEEQVIEKWDDELEHLAGKLKSLRERPISNSGGYVSKSELEARENQVQSLEREINGLQNSVYQLKKDLSVEQNRKKELTIEVGKLNSAVSKFEKENRKYVIAIEDGKLNIADLKRDLASKESELSLLKKSGKNLHEKNISLSKDSKKHIEVLEKTINELESRVSKYKTSEKEKTVSISDLKDEVKNLTSNLKNRNQNAREVESVLEKDIKSLNKMIQTKEEEIIHLKKKLESWHEIIRNELDEAIEFIRIQAVEINRLNSQLKPKDTTTPPNEGY